MYLTRIVLNLEDRFARADLANPYEMHSTLSRAFVATAGAEKPSPFLWRQELARNQPVLLVQSPYQPIWVAVQERARNWALDISTKVIDLDRLCEPSATLRFRLRANPTVTRQGKRHGLWKEEDQLAWLGQQAVRAGFELRDTSVINPEKIFATRRRSSTRVIVQAVTFDGILQVTERQLFVKALSNGLGHAKFLGLGLLSIAPAHR
jgi:CRISPR system Cascade subunit CasE